MMKRVASVLCYIVAGFFVYLVAMLAFITSPSVGFKLALMAGFSVPGVIAMIVGLALSEFRHTLRDIGIVLLAGAGVGTMVVGSFVCMMATEEYRQMMPADALANLGDHKSGAAFLVAEAVLGAGALWMAFKRTGGNGVPPPLGAA